MPNVPEIRPQTGLSPRLRGNHCPVQAADRGTRSIPAPAGEPTFGLPSRFQTRVYPRACGGTTPCNPSKR